METRSGRVARTAAEVPAGEAVCRIDHLLASGFTRSAIRAQLDAYRWQLRGRAVVLHNGPLHAEETARVALLNCGPRAALTAFTAAELRGLTGWTRDAVHVLVPAGANVCRPPGVSLRLHWTARWPDHEVFAGSHALAPALALAAATFASPRPACGLLAASVQQGLVRPDDLRCTIAANPRRRHRAALLRAIEDIAEGAEALSEIDFGRLCRRHGLPPPLRQAVRIEPSGRRRYVDAEFITATGRRLVVEVDGALHLAPRRWWDDQLRQNELALRGDLVLRFPSVVVRHEEMAVVAQLRRALAL